ncbi:MAG: NUDIX domain-containing protein, partial [Microvirga sp.]
ILVHQFRAPVFHVAGADALLEAPAGGLDEDDPEACARREAEEETGLVLRDLEPVAAAWTMPGVSTERLHLFLAPFRAADRVGEGGGLAEEHENIVVVETALADLAGMADRGEIEDLKTLALVQSLRLRHPALF